MRRDEQGDEPHQHPAQQFDIDAERLGVALAEREQIYAPAQSEQQRAGDERDPGDERDFFVSRAGETAEQPIDDGGQFHRRIGERLHKADERAAKAANDDARQDERERARASGEARQSESRGERKEAGAEGEADNSERGPGQHDRRDAAKRGAGRNPGDLRSDERIAKDALHGRARHGEPHAAKRDEQYARHAHDFDDDPRRVRVIARGVDRKRRQDDARDFAKRHRITPERQREENEKS